MKKVEIYITLFAALTLNGCASMAPKYVQPALPVPATVNGTETSQSVAPESDAKPINLISDVAWREYFGDEKLQKVISLAIENNRDLKVAILNIERFKALYQIRDSDLLPKLDATAAAGFQRVPETLSASGKSMTTEQYSIGLGMSSYELDLFGRVSSLKDQALEEFLASEYARRATQITIVSQVAHAYLSLAADSERLKLSKETLANQGKSYTLTKSLFDAGMSDALALNQAESTVNAARVNIARFATLVGQDKNALNLLAGSQLPTELLPEGFSESLDSLDIVMPGQGSEIHLNRPDILESESRLKALNANIGAARAA
ncbi:MAG: TolC family protein, partial [Desulfuromonadaceae bacterium]|nr:TolC family protein [Desulfuromonadaceae bacterium]